MKAPLRKQLWTELAALINAQVPQFAPYEAKSPYIWPGEFVLSAGTLIAPKTAFIVLSPEPKGRDQFTIELAWSPDPTFPELAQRPSGVPNQHEALLARDKAAMRLLEWTDVEKDTVKTVAKRAVAELRSVGIPYLLRVSR